MIYWLMEEKRIYEAIHELIEIRFQQIAWMEPFEALLK